MQAQVLQDLQRKMVFIDRRLPPGDFWFFDEIHKHRGWRNDLKGLFDQTFARRWAQT